MSPLDQLLNKYNPGGGPQPLPQAQPQPANTGLAMQQLMQTPPPMNPTPMTQRPEEQQQQRPAGL